MQNQGFPQYDEQMWQGQQAQNPPPYPQPSATPQRSKQAKRSVVRKKKSFLKSLFVAIKKGFTAKVVMPTFLVTCLLAGAIFRVKQSKGAVKKPVKTEKKAIYYKGKLQK